MAKRRCQKPKQPSNKKKTPDPPGPPIVTRCVYQSLADYEYVVHKSLFSDAIWFRHRSHYGPDLEQKTLIWRGNPPFIWTEKSSGISWIGVTGKDSTCVASMWMRRHEDSLRPRPLGRRQLPVSDLLTTVLADMSVGVCTNTSTVFHQHMLSHKHLSEEVVEPFAVVSVAPGFVADDNGYEGRVLAVRFLEKRLELNPSFTSDETTQIAICALKFLLGPEFKSDRIQVRGFGNWSGGTGIVNVNEVDQHLAAGNAMDLTYSFDSIVLSSPEERVHDPASWGLEART